MSLIVGRVHDSKDFPVTGHHGPLGAPLCERLTHDQCQELPPQLNRLRNVVTDDMSRRPKLMVASPRLGPKAVVNSEKREEPKHAMLPPNPTDLLDVALQVQKSQDLDGWWQVVSDILEERFDAIRAELAVPPDESDCEVRPWEQLASFTRPSGDKNASLRPPPPGPVIPSSGKPSRPRLGSRHSFQGYPSSPLATDASTAKSSNSTSRRPGLPRTNSSENAKNRLVPSRIGVDGGMLSPTSLKRHFLETPERLGENSRSYEAPAGETGPRVFRHTRSLDIEPHALITRTDVARCLEKGQILSNNTENERIVLYIPLVLSSPNSSSRRRFVSRQPQSSRSTHSPKPSFSGYDDRPESPSMGPVQEEKVEPTAILSILSSRRMTSTDTPDLASLAPLLAGSLVNMRRICEIEDQLFRAKSEAEKKLNHLHTMSHELRTPLNGMIGNMQLMSNSGLNDHQQDWVHGALNAARGMNEILNDVLDIAKAEARMLSLSYEWFRIRSTMEEVVETLGSKANEKRLELCYDLDDRVPVMVKGDGMRIRQVLLNLVGNAIKFTRHGEIYFDCRVVEGKSNSKSEQPEMTLVFRVIDSGCGFSDDNAKLLFRPYSQINNSATRANKGTGLGLTLCKQMVELHGGHISATSNGLGKGSTFTFTARFRLASGKDHPDFSRALPHSPNFQIDGQPSRSIVSSPDSFSIDTIKDGTAYMDLPVRPQLLLSKSESLLGPLALSLQHQHTQRTREVSSPVLMPKADSKSVASRSYDILIVCPQEHTLRTTKAYIEQVLPESIPTKITTSSSENIASNVYLGQDVMPFTHVVLQLPEAHQVLTYMESLLGSVAQRHAFLIIVTDQEQESEIKQCADHDYDQMAIDQRLTFILKPTKPPKFAKIFDPHGRSASSKEYKTAKGKESKAQAYQRFKEKLGPLNIRVLAVEDNGTNMKVPFSYHRVDRADSSSLIAPLYVLDQVLWV